MYNLQKNIDRILELTSNKGLSINQMLKNAGVSTSIVGNMKRNRLPSIDKIQLIAEYLGCSVDYLLGRTETVELTAVELTDKKNDLKDIKLFLEMFPEKINGFIYENDIVQPPSKFKGSNVYFVRAVHYNKLEEIYNKAFEFDGDNIISKEEYEDLFEFFKDKISGDFGAGFTLTKDNYKEFKKVYDTYVKSFTSRIFISYRN